MKNERFVNNLLAIFMALINIGLSIAVVFLMGHVQNLLNSDVKINLTEIVTQNKDSITSRLMLNLNSLDIIAHRFIESFKVAESLRKTTPEAFLEAYGRANNTANLFVANKAGVVLRRDGTTMDISGRSYFRLVVSGTPNISDKVISRLNGEEVFVSSVPLRLGGEIIGSIQRIYTPEELYALCALSLFSDQGYMYLINSSGYVILHSEHDNCHKKSDNYFRDVYGSGNTKASRQLESDIKAGRSGFMETIMDGEEIFSAYTPIEKVHDWFLISSVPNSAVSPNGSTVIKLFYVILFVLVFMFTSCLTYFLWYKNKQRVNLERIAFFDAVTKGNTYTKFLVDAKRILAANSGGEFYLLKFDIDNFKYINKFYGFEFGDKVLQQINAKVTRYLRPQEVMGRVSGDHFVLLLKDVSESRLNVLLAAIENEDVIIYFSAGIYVITDKTESINLMIDKASIAVQSIKGMLDKKLAYYSEKFEQDTMRNEQLKRSVRQAILHSEFIPYYQPKVNILAGELTGGEALVRWQTAEGKFIFPNEFIPMCEQLGIIVEIDMIVYEKVLKFLKVFLEQNLACVPISVNFSRLHLLNHDFINKIVDMRRQYEVPAHLIEIELTESAIFDNMESIALFTKQMHEHGFLVAMDDFGSGYSSLNMLKDIPIDILKIDKGFLSETTDNSRRNIIFASIAEMARKLKIKVVVEGVETVGDVELMRECGCFVAQGYYFAKPMPEADFAKIFREGKLCVTT